MLGSRTFVAIVLTSLTIADIVAGKFYLTSRDLGQYCDENAKIKIPGNFGKHIPVRSVISRFADNLVNESRSEMFWISLVQLFDFFEEKCPDGISVIWGAVEAALQFPWVTEDFEVLWRVLQGMVKDGDRKYFVILDEVSDSVVKAQLGLRLRTKRREGALGLLRIVCIYDDGMPGILSSLQALNILTRLTMARGELPDTFLAVLTENYHANLYLRAAICEAATGDASRTTMVLSVARRIARRDWQALEEIDRFRSLIFDNFLTRTVVWSLELRFCVRKISTLSFLHPFLIYPSRWFLDFSPILQLQAASLVQAAWSASKSANALQISEYRLDGLV